LPFAAIVHGYLLRVSKIITPKQQKRFDMILIADSGSTKTEWVLLEGKQIIREVNTFGINPYFMTVEQMGTILQNELLPQLQQNDTSNIDTLFYYGAGCSSDEKCGMISQSLKYFFPNTPMLIYHDLLGAARAACGTEEGIAVILGTGSNSCLFNGEQIVANQPSLGFILGDEGSGGYIGKELLKLFLYNELPPALTTLFQEEYALTKEIILNKIYKELSPNRYAASFTRFVSRNIHYPEMQTLVIMAFDEFFKRHISSYPNFQQYPISVVGSIGFIFEKQLKQVATKYHCSIKRTIQKPMDGLIHYHSA
jgi:N-acetylglucosamine kinase-like BadF-type ATPase